MTFKEKKNKEWHIFVNQGKDAIKELFSKKWYRQIPNLLTFSRTVAPFIVLPLVSTGNIIGAIIAELCFAITDTFDGLIARKFNLTSDFGKRLDTISDKIFAITLLLPIYTIMPLISITIGLEILIGVINSIATIKGNNPSSSLLGKTKTFFLSGGIILGYLAMLSQIPTHVVNFAFAITSILQSGAAIDYYVTDKFKDIEKARLKEVEINNENNQEENKIIEEQKTEKKTKEIEYNNNFPKEDLHKTKTKRLY